MSISLNADAIRDEVADRGTFTDGQIAAFDNLPDDELESAIHEVVGDAFWEFFDETRSAAIRYIMRRHNLGDEA